MIAIRCTNRFRRHRFLNPCALLPRRVMNESGYPAEMRVEGLVGLRSEIYHRALDHVLGTSKSPATNPPTSPVRLQTIL